MIKQIYFDSYTNSLNYCFNNIDNYKVNKNDNFHNQITFTKKPSLHTTNILTLDIIYKHKSKIAKYMNDNYKLHIQVFRMSLNKYELNYYIA